MLIFIPNPGGALQLEDGLGGLLLENGDTLSLESSVAEYMLQVIDENPIYAIPYHWLQPFFSFQSDPGTFFETVWFPGIGQQMQEVVMPTYDERYFFGDISNQPYFSLQLFDNVHFGPDGTGTFQGPSDLEILEGPSDFELRTPE